MGSSPPLGKFSSRQKTLAINATSEIYKIYDIVAVIIVVIVIIVAVIVAAVAIVTVAHWQL